MNDIDILFETAEKEKHVHSRSGEVFDAIAGLWLLGDELEAVLARIGRNYIVSSFLLNSLGFIYKRISADHDLPEFHAIELTDTAARVSFLTDLQKVKSDSLAKWLKDELVETLERALDSYCGENLEAVSRLGNLSDSIQRIAELYVDREDGEIWVYDSLFQFAEEVSGLHRESE